MFWRDGIGRCGLWGVLRTRGLDSSWRQMLLSIIGTYHLEQDHRGIKQWYRPTGGLRTFRTAAQFCRAFDELRAFLRPQSCRSQRVSLAQRRATHQERFTT